MSNLKPSTLFLLLLPLLLTTLHCLTVDQTKISTSRSELRTSLCNFYNGNFTDEQREHVKPLIKSYGYLTEDKIQSMLFKQDFANPAIQSFLIAAPHAASLAILIIMIPGLACCCARPEKYPTCKKFRKPEDQMYTRVELKWPAFCTIFCYLVISIGAAAALAGGPDVTNHVNNIGCRLVAVADDTINGRISPTDDTVFFVGLGPLKTEFVDFGAKLNTFFSQSNTSLNASQAVRTTQTSLENQLITSYSSYTDIAYSMAFRQSNGITYATIPSQFKNLYYGPQTDSTKILGNIWSQLDVLYRQVNAALDPMITEWVYLEGQGQAAVAGELGDTVTEIGLHQAQLEATIANYEYFHLSQKQQQYTSINLGIKLVYGIVLALSLLGLISSIVLTFCTVVRIRLVLYFTCSFLIFMGVITFCMLIVFAIFLPNVAQACKYVDTKLESEAGTVDLFTKLQFNYSAPLFTKCSVTAGTGDVIDKVNSGFSQAFNAIDLLATYTLKFNDLIPNFQSANFLRPFTESATLIQQIKTAVKLEINDTTSLSFLRGLANKAFTVDPVLCTNAANVNSDSWVPSRTVISCQGGTYAQSPCNDLSSTVTCALGCYEMYQELNIAAGDSTAYATHLNSRYGNGCNYANYVIDLQQNWTLPKKSSLASVQSNLDTIQTNVNTYQSKVSTIQGNLNSFKSNLLQNFNSQTNLATGSFNGLDCRVLGSSIIELRDSVCYNVIMLGMISYGILLMVCFTVCAGVRHYRHLKNMQVKIQYKGVPVSISSNRIIDKFDS